MKLPSILKISIEFRLLVYEFRTELVFAPFLYPEILGEVVQKYKMDLLEKGITDHYHLSVIFASLKDCKHTQSVLVISHSKCRNMSSLSFPL